MRRVPGRRRRRPQAKRTRCQKSLKLNICQLQTASGNAQKSNTKFAIIQNWRWRKKPLVSGLLFRIFFVGLLFFQLARLAGLRARTLRCAACGLRLAICLIYFLNWRGRISICASCRMPQPVSDSSARHDKVSVCLYGKKGKFTQFDIEFSFGQKW